MVLSIWAWFDPVVSDLLTFRTEHYCIRGQGDWLTWIETTLEVSSANCSPQMSQADSRPGDGGQLYNALLLCGKPNTNGDLEHGCFLGKAGHPEASKWQRGTMLAVQV